MADKKHTPAADEPAKKPHAGASHRGAERPDGAPQPSGGASQQPADIKGESEHAPHLQPGHDPNDKAGHNQR